MSVKTIKNMVDWIEENITENPTLRQMSDYVGYSSFYCSEKFHEYVGVTFKEYISKRKLSLAALEMKNTNRRVLDIAIDYGFSSQEAFTRAFFNAYGYTPYKYRRQLPEILLFNKVKIT
ncbi:AraC family transcriptional regulator [Clostridium sp. OS1-26]|uniref:helix-turn-helix transcriptional regulator n=1 Tax=Clostridium sp. OS1-26 TaxID=3070681 RepID=UPI0027E0B8A7|nr:AraC family transcriptional regulator [Clostridium sp. OS1-26]WML34672.1 AraC family transcriptional regulator [Clostridium sp. OS1-26]